MWRLYQFQLCPFSRKVRVVLAEKNVPHELVRESPWERRDEFLHWNPSAETPVMVEEARGTVLIDSGAICEYLEETVQSPPLIPGAPSNRAEVRRLIAWFDEKLHDQVVAPLLEERMRKRLVKREAPDTRVLRQAMKIANGHLDYIDTLLDERRWLGGAQFSLADIAAAAQLSVADYLGGIDWRGHQQTVDWYAVMKSRPSFRSLLADRMEGILPPPHYDKVDF